MIGHVSSFVRAVNNKLIYVWILETWLYELLGLVACLVYSMLYVNIDPFLKKTSQERFKENKTLLSSQHG